VVLRENLHNDNNIREGQDNEEIKYKLLNKGLSLVGMSDKEIIFHKLKPRFLH